jgi:hypothetical protein
MLYQQRVLLDSSNESVIDVNVVPKISTLLLTVSIELVSDRSATRLVDRRQHRRNENSIRHFTPDVCLVILSATTHF